MKTITVEVSKTYDVQIGAGLLDEAGRLLMGLAKSGTVAVVTDDVVDTLYASRLLGVLSVAGFKTVKFVFEHGERHKNADTYIRLLNFLADNQLTRSDTIVALGGGVVGDLAGFAASTYLRGIRLVQIPTTVLAAVDSSVGGKTAIDLDAGKNLAGTFYQPDLVICDTSLMDTLTDETFRDGLAEVIKYAVIADTELFSLLQKPIRPQLEEIIARCVTVKRDVVTIDEKEAGPRKLLNFGHTVGHAIEARSGYTILHGHAVAAGMAITAHAAVKMGICGEKTALDLVALIASLGLPTTSAFSPAELAAEALHDKKRTGDTITLVLPQAIGTCVLQQTPTNQLERFISLGLQGGIKHEADDH